MANRDFPVQWIEKGVGMIEQELKHIVYDLSIKDIEERKAKAKHFDTANEVVKYLGVRVETIFRNRAIGKKVTALNKKQYAVRVIKK